MERIGFAAIFWLTAMSMVFPEMHGKLIPFAKLCRFDNNSQLIPNDNIDTYFPKFCLKLIGTGCEPEITVGRVAQCY